jgi:hypothetical protein
VIGPDGEEYDIDLGDGHFGRYVGWAPDRALNPQYEGIADIERVGMTIYHPAPGKTESGHCAGFVHFDTPEVSRVFTQERSRWQVLSWEPLTLAPSLLCGTCGDHGFIRNGTWERA